MQGERGERGERQAEDWLRRKGLKTVARNYQCRAGEIDLVMLDPNPADTEVLAFVEVRLRGAGAQVDGIDSVDVHKQRKLVAAARHFLMTSPEWAEHACRFDVIGISDADGALRWVPGAFEAGE
jgi:putative endonuclease